MEENVAIELINVSKNYQIYDRARDRIKEAFSITRKKYYKEFNVISDVSLKIHRGEVLGIFGLNGAGKSTLLKMIAGVLTPTKGSVKVAGNINAMLELGGALNPELTGRQNINLNMDISGVDVGQRELLTKQIIDFAEIGPHIDQPVKTYSSGMSSRLGFGIATSTKPDILIVDEVLAVGDAIFQNKCFLRVRDLLKGGTTVVFVSHSVSLMTEFCSRAILLHNKKIVLDGDVREIGNIYQKVMFSDDQEKALNEIQRKLNERKEGEKLEIFDTDFDNSGVYENDYAKIFNSSVRDEHNKDVCLLVTGEGYSFEFDVEFKQKFKQVKISYELCDITGGRMPTLSKYKDDVIIKDIEVGSVYKVVNNFNNDLYYGQYNTIVMMEGVNLDGEHIDISVTNAKTKFTSSAPSSADGYVEVKKLD
ncbi:ATP-binding cassette domain-containing protein [Francisella philomiragia]|uniref:ABC transporter family protein n=1 Tax=Francisella philomiragia TaxID=28110 RepID=A0AAW3DAJ4_9GAMM|nr:ABC transporter ATP-binding protein [Francisella philomiragia]KFJ42659.1 ABC transporter family protein [Francisella philomiragia]MBK2255591.1 ATP-binding cassette domain-containing protein [Francisella philomiragia]MBK2273917.1 ATP-binding cassette domain-containing protein [Francisella philomiragia]MBK2277746.1 ATP-binding cassette domain-containing protein [Francisella philomiragia]MBK2281664.1 ATP-binding cassette domain-containing protein [Francisella philomiragia]